MSMLISIDNGGTLTDACVIYGAQVFHAKTLTTPHDLTQCFVQVLKEVSKRIYGEARLDALLEEVDYIRYSTTQGTNAVVQRKGPRLGLILRRGQKLDSIIRNEDERELLDAMVSDRVASIDPTLAEDKLESHLTKVINELMSAGANRVVVSLGGDSLAADETKVKRMALLRYPRHLLGAVPILYSHQLSDDADDGRRTWSSIINAFLHPAMERFLYNAENVLREARARNPLLIFCNDGTSSRVAKTVALKTWGSGPRGGMEGAKALARHYRKNTLLTMDIGGTTTDIGVVDRGNVREQRWGALENIKISFPLCEVESLGAGGSSVFKVVDGKIQVGPESVGGAPGPACFGYGGTEATITDAYLLLGILDGDSYFGGTLKLDSDRAKAAITENVAKPLGLSLDEALVRMESAYTVKIADAMREIAPSLTDAALLAFGGAGPMSACRVADALGVREIIVPRMAAVFSAFGIGFSDIAHSYDAALTDSGEKGLTDVIDRLTERATRDMFAEGFDLSECTLEKTLSFTQNGEQATRRLNGEMKVPDGLKDAQDLRMQLRATKAIPHFALKPDDIQGGKAAATELTRRVRLSDGGKLADASLPLYRHAELAAGQGATGPAVVEEEYFTCLIPAGWKFQVNDNHDLVLQKN
ncbi:hydantoinase/oxoprolinase family protein [Panacagrimonas sp.]|uniref:hydantoinase/oxoprolinase family protein n=1 Tax=Panacagrimonas sp. TaxID=2480088 RepID=UPI003B527614